MSGGMRAVVRSVVVWLGAAARLRQGGLVLIVC